MSSIKQRLQDEWDSPGEQDDNSTQERIWTRVKSGIYHSRKERTIIKGFSIAAAVAACIAIGILISVIHDSTNPSGSSDEEYVQFASNNGERTLPDGSKVWMEMGAEIRYDVNFMNNRQVKLKGNAVFEVVHTADSSPFEVILNDAKIIVTGTCFTIRESKDDLSVTLHNGKIDFMNESSNQKVRLTPNQQLTYSFNDSTLAVKEFFRGITWQSGSYKLDNVSMDQLTAFLKWKYGITFDSSGFLKGKSLKLNGAIGLNETTEQVLDKITYLLGMEYSYHDNKVLLYNK